MKKRAILLSGSLLILLLVAGCAPHAIPAAGAPGAAAGFWKGLWHGFILLFTFIVSLFSDGVGVYEVHNSGNLYDLGFLLGVMFFFGGSCGGACKKTC
ncbi:hypothetical protein H8E07_16075 [bacterium]|nr:hypothetical protein [bacterium]